ncbi:DUF2867 domain-containing protein [Altererythrobacter sp. JGD-16]|uniref:DUF2867 domain-containing protein n=1 Tax=Altererythrobacter lutimaris TaxID=2743979 RepID=A0A850H7V9_9SPHN|nr:DUF2867 domain-containing protein [Altererythrobacter lutimaris]
MEAVTLPSSSALHDRVAASDFCDCFAVPADVPVRRAAGIITSWPGWASALLALRKVVTAPFGLSQDGPPAEDKIGPFPVELETKDEIIAGFDDRHLNFRVSVLADQGKVHLATWVHPHNWAGRLYLVAIMPFHIAIARDALARVAAFEDDRLIA